MTRPEKVVRLGGGPAHERLLLANLAGALFKQKSIITTETKAHRMRPLVERLITFARRGDSQARRRVLALIGNKAIVEELFTEIAPLIANPIDGNIRITKLGIRKADGASMVRVELLLQPHTSDVKPSTMTAPTPLQITRDPVHSRQIGKLPATSRDDLARLAATLGITIRGYGRDSSYGPLSAWVLGTRSLRRMSEPPALLQITRAPSRRRGEFLIQLSWSGTEPDLDDSLLEAISEVITR